MAVNLVNRIPVPGQFGVAASSNVQFELTSDNGILSSTIDVLLNDEDAIVNGVFQSGFSGTITPTVSGWLVLLNPSALLPSNTECSVGVHCVESVTAADFTQEYTFTTERNIQVVGTVQYYEEGDVLEATLYPYENDAVVPSVVDSVRFFLLRNTTVIETFVFDNSARNVEVEGQFHISILHPRQLGDDLTWSCSLDLSPFEAPGLGTLFLGGEVDLIRNTQRYLDVKQPDHRTLDTMPRNMETGENEYYIREPEASTERQIVDLSKSPDGNVTGTVLVDLNFVDTQQYIQVLHGDPTYIGGGNRLLPSVSAADRYLLQDFSEIPATFGARFFSEPTTTNIVANSKQLTQAFFTVGSYDPTIKFEEELVDLTEDSSVKAAKYRIEGGVVYDGTDRNVTLSSNRFSVSSLVDPVRLSLLCRVLPRDASVTLDLFRLRATFFNSSDAQLGTYDFDFNVFDFESDRTFHLMEGIVPVLSLPVGTTQVSMSIVLGSWEGCDLLQMWVAAPCIDRLPYTTTPVVGSSVAQRQADVFKISGYGNLNTKFGTVLLSYIPQFSGSPPVDTTIWDTRDSALLNGYVLMHKQNGDLVLQVYDTVGLSHTEISAAFVPEAEQSLVVSWALESLAVKSGQTILMSYTGAYTQPSSPNAHISVGCRMDGVEQALSEIVSFRIWS